MTDGPEWFAPKRYGFGAGLPISWQGWAVTIAFLLVTVLLVTTLGDHPVKFIASIIVPTLAFLLIAFKTTRGGWRWRWGEKD